MTTAPLDGVRIEYELAGTPGQRRLLSISGSGSDLRRPPRTQDEAVLAERFEILAYDHRGLGRSVPDDPHREPTMADYAADAVGLLDHVGWDTCRVLGISFGGMVAQELAVTAPVRIERLVLACTSPGGAGGSSSPLHTLLDMADDERLAQQVAWLDDRTVDDPELRAFWTEMMAGLAGGEPTEGERHQLQARSHHDVWDRLPQLALPVLIAAGRFDGIALPANQEALARQIEGADLRWFDGGHAFFLQDRTALPAIADWLAEG
ncbi:MAG TPA: alpha/beta hydrolase [Acidimicrobiales bacterium]|nr:alpha/beta hydrolase [Acidimicrobiales bacterium]